MLLLHLNVRASKILIVIGHGMTSPAERADTK